MTRSGPRTLAFLVPGLVCLGIATAAGVQLYEGLMRDFYWTPIEQSPDLDEAQPDVEVWLDDDLLQRQAELGHLLDEEGAPIGPDRLRVRINRRDRVQRGQIALLAGAGGAGLAFLIAAFAVSGRASGRERAG